MLNPIGKITRAITHPVHTAGSAAGQALGLAAAGARTTARVMDWTASHMPGSDEAPDPGPAGRQGNPDATPRPAPVPDRAQDSPPSTPAEAELDAPTRPKPPTKKPAKKPATRKAPAKKAPSAQAATAGPALAAAAKAAGDDPSLVTPTVTASDEGASTSDDADPAEPLLDLSVAKAIRNESEVLSKAADPHKG